MSVAARRYFTPQEYLELERAGDVKCEYFNGEIFAMAGASLQHNRITRNLSYILAGQFREGPCEVFASELRVKVDPTGLYTYPDLIVACGNLQFEDRQLDTLLNPRLIIEVLSASTAEYDRGEKFAQYRRLDSLQEYLLVSQDRCRVERYVRKGNDWVLTEFSDPEIPLPLESLGCVVRLPEIYERVEFPPDLSLR